VKCGFVNDPISMQAALGVGRAAPLPPPFAGFCADAAAVIGGERVSHKLLEGQFAADIETLRSGLEAFLLGESGPARGPTPPTSAATALEQAGAAGLDRTKLESMLKPATFASSVIRLAWCPPSSSPCRAWCPPSSNLCRVVVPSLE
jgi:hypothetical protein